MEESRRKLRSDKVSNFSRTPSKRYARQTVPCFSPNQQQIQSNKKKCPSNELSASTSSTNLNNSTNSSFWNGMKNSSKFFKNGLSSSIIKYNMRSLTKLNNNNRKNNNLINNKLVSSTSNSELKTYRTCDSSNTISLQNHKSSLNSMNKNSNNFNSLNGQKMNGKSKDDALNAFVPASVDKVDRAIKVDKADKTLKLNQFCSNEKLLSNANASHKSSNENNLLINHQSNGSFDGTVINSSALISQIKSVGNIIQKMQVSEASKRQAKEAWKKPKER